MTDDFYKQKTLPGVSVPEGEEQKVPEEIGPYRIEGSLEKGGMSELYLATDPKTHEPLVVKALATRFVAHPEMKERFHKEAEVIRLTDHPNIVKLLGHGEWEGGLYIAMEFVQGISLRQLLLQHTLSMRRALELVLQVASALEHLHSHGVIHRDLKPENILLTASGGIKVIDFGIAQLGSEPIDQKTGRVMGTPVYMSPEQQKNPLTVAPNADIYSLGMITYELAIGRTSHGAVHLRLVPPNLQTILAKALDPDPEKRYKEVFDFSRDLTAYLESDQISRDQKGRGYAQDLAEHLRVAQAGILPAEPPQWRHVDIGFASHQDLNVSGLYYDFLNLDENQYGVLLSEPSSTGVEGVIHSAMLHGIFHTVTPSTDIRKINQIIVSHPIDQVFTLNWLILDPARNELHYTACGYGPLWLIRAGTKHAEVMTSHNIALGIDRDAEFLPVTHNWNVGDTLILSTLHAGKEEEVFRETLEQVLYSSPQSQAEAILRRLVYQEELPTSHRPLTVIALHRKA